MTSVSVVIATYDRPDDLVECLESLDQQFVQPDEVVVIDDGDVERTRRKISEAGLDDVCHINGDNEGLPASRNLGVEATNGDIVCFVDDDVVLPPNWLQEILRAYEDNEQTKGVGGLVMNYNPENINKANMASPGYRLLTGVRYALFYDRLGEISPLGILYAPHIFMTAGYRRVDSLQGCNMSFRREVFEEYAFDEWYGTGGSAACEEIDFCSRVTNGQKEFIYNPRAVALHKRSPAGDTRSTDPNYANITNLAHFVLRCPKLGFTNYLLLLGAITVYAGITRDVNYLKAALQGFHAYRARSE